MKRNLHAIVPVALFAFTALVAATGHAQAANAVNVPGGKTEMVSTTEMTEGEVRKIDKETQKITLKHGEIKNLGMPGITLVFKVKNAEMLDTLQVGSKVRFTAQKSEGSLVVTAIQVAS